MREQDLGIRHPLGGWDWDVSLLELCEHAGLCLPVLSHTEKDEAKGEIYVNAAVSESSEGSEGSDPRGESADQDDVQSVQSN